MVDLEERKVEYLYSEPIKGDVKRWAITSRSDETIDIRSTTHQDDYVLSNKVYPDGSYFLEGIGSFFPETEEWKVKYQNSLYLRVCQSNVVVYFVQAVKRGKVNTRALVIDDNGACYHTYVPTVPTPRLGEKFIKLRMDLEVVSLEPVKDLWDKVMKVRREDYTL